MLTWKVPSQMAWGFELWYVESFWEIDLFLLYSLTPQEDTPSSPASSTPSSQLLAEHSLGVWEGELRRGEGFEGEEGCIQGRWAWIWFSSSVLQPGLMGCGLEGGTCPSDRTRGGENPSQPYKNVMMLGGFHLGKDWKHIFHCRRWPWWLSALGKVGLSHDIFGIIAVKSMWSNHQLNAVLWG